MNANGKGSYIRECPSKRFQSDGYVGARSTPRGAHAPSRVVSDALVGNRVEWHGRRVFGVAPKTTREGACAPQDFCLRKYPSKTVYEALVSEPCANGSV